MRLVVALIMPVWGVVMLAIGLRAGAGWWIATGAGVVAISAVLFRGSSLMSAFPGSAALRPERQTDAGSA